MNQNRSLCYCLFSFSLPQRKKRENEQKRTERKVAESGKKILVIDRYMQLKLVMVTYTYKRESEREREG